VQCGALELVHSCAGRSNFGTCFSICREFNRSWPNFGSAAPGLISYFIVCTGNPTVVASLHVHHGSKVFLRSQPSFLVSDPDVIAGRIQPQLLAQHHWNGRTALTWAARLRTTVTQMISLCRLRKAHQTESQSPSQGKIGHRTEAAAFVSRRRVVRNFPGERRALGTEAK